MNDQPDPQKLNVLESPDDQPNANAISFANYQAITKPTKLFILKWLNLSARLGRYLDPDTAYSQMLGDATQAHWPTVADLIQRMDYREFCKTLYWRVLGDQIRKRDGRHCRQCGSHNRLECHHVTYQYLGHDHLHLETLQLFCRVCHLLWHGDLMGAIMADQQLLTEGEKLSVLMDGVIIYTEGEPEKFGS